MLIKRLLQSCSTCANNVILSNLAPKSHLIQFLAGNANRGLVGNNVLVRFNSSFSFSGGAGRDLSKIERDVDKIAESKLFFTLIYRSLCNLTKHPIKQSTSIFSDLLTKIESLCRLVQ